MHFEGGSHKKIFIAYSIDFLLISLCSGLAFLIERLPPFTRVVFLDDIEIKFPFQTNDYIPGWSLPFFCIGIPLIFVIVTSWAKKRTFWATFIAIMGNFFDLSKDYYFHVR